MNKFLQKLRSIFTLISIRSKLEAMILLACLLVILLTGCVSYISAKQALKEGIYNNLTLLRTRQAVALNAFSDRIESEIQILSGSNLLIKSFKAFKTAYEKLNSQSITPEQKQKLKEFYQKEVFPNLKLGPQGDPIVETYIPSSLAGQYLQFHYLASNPNPINASEELDRASDDSEYSKVHGQVHPNIRRIVKEYGSYDNIIIIDGETGDVIYTVSKEIDLGTNLKRGVYSHTNLAKAFNEALKVKNRNYIVMVDFENYLPSYDRPTAFIATNIFDDNKFLGVLVFQISPEPINRFMTVNQKWQEVGLGNTGESFLIGPDSYLRSEKRLFLENPELYFKYLPQVASGATIKRIRDIGTPILQQKVKTKVAEKVLGGQQGTKLSQDDLGQRILSSYQPLEFLNLDWALITEIDEAEAFKSIHQLNRRLLIAAAIILPLITLIANWFSQIFTRPIELLVQGTKRLAKGEKNVQVKIYSRDEFGQLANSFNIMTQKLYEKEQNLQEKLQENENLLLNILPPSAVKRVQAGNMNFADHYASVSLLYAAVDGLSDLAAQVPPQESVQLLNELIGAFDETAENYGIEKLKTVGTNYIAVSGLSIPRVDHAKRCVDFSLALLEILQNFSQKYNFELTLGIGVHSGSVVGGIVGKSKFIYELWGETMKITDAIHVSSDPNVIHVTEPVYHALENIYHFKQIDDVLVKGIGKVPVWILSESREALDGKG